MTPAKRERVIKIRVTDEEFARLKGLSGDERLAEWMRSQCLGNDKAAGRRRTPVPKADPALLRQLAGIGNNLNQVGVTSENGKNRTVSRWHGLASRKRSFLRGFNENQIRASAGMACCFLENHSHIARLKQPSFENHENAVSRGWQLAQSRAVAGYRIS